MSISRSKYIQRIHFIQLAAFIGVLLIGFTLLLKVENLLVSFVLAFVTSYVLGPLVNSLERVGFPRLWSLVLVFSLVGAIIAVGIVAILPLLQNQVLALQSEIPKYADGTSELVASWQMKIDHFLGSSSPFKPEEHIKGLITSWTQSLFGDLPSILSNSLTTLFLAPFLAFFIIKDGRQFSQSLFAIVPNNLFELFLNLYHRINDQMGQFVRARIIEAAIVGALVWIGLWLVGFPFAFLLAIFAALTNLIPYVGPIIGAIPPLLIAIVNGEPTFVIVMVCLVYFVAQVVDAAFIIPLVVAKIVNLHPITVVLAIIIGAQLLGVLGMIISIPVASALKVTFVSVYDHLVNYRS